MGEELIVRAFITERAGRAVLVEGKPSAENMP